MKIAEGLHHLLESGNPSRKLIAQELQEFRDQLPGQASVLDAGAGSAPYRNLFEDFRYESTDLEQNPQGSHAFVGDLVSIPRPDGHYNAILLNQVLEHCPNPRAILAELQRVLVKGGYLFYTGPFFFEPHLEPHDYYRYSSHGLRWLCMESGLTVQRIDPLEGHLGTSGYMLTSIGRTLPLRLSAYNSTWRAALAWPFILAVRISSLIIGPILSHLELRLRATPHFPKNYIMVAVKH